MAENLDCFFLDDLIAVDVVFDEDTLRGIYNAPGELIGSDMVISTEHSVLMKTSDTTDMATNDEIQVDDVDYYVRQVTPEADGKFSRVTLSKQ